MATVERSSSFTFHTHLTELYINALPGRLSYVLTPPKTASITQTGPSAGAPMMNSNISWLLVRLAILLGVFLVQSSDGATYRDFLNSHVVAAGPGNTNLNAYCNRMMVQRRLTRRTCKITNTFIIANANSVQQVCRGGGTRWRGNLYDSRASFQLVVCRRTGGRPPTGCQYRGRRLNKRIRLGCVRNRPVHFQKSL